MHARPQRVLEGGVDPAPSPAVHIENLKAEADCFFLTLTALQGRGAHRTGLGTVPGEALPLRHTHSHTHLDKLQHGTEGGALTPAVSFGTVLVAVGGQSAQGTAEGVHVLVNKVLLQGERRRVREQKPELGWLSTRGWFSELLLSLRKAFSSLPDPPPPPNSFLALPRPDAPAQRPLHSPWHMSLRWGYFCSTVTCGIPFIQPG